MTRNIITYYSAVNRNAEHKENEYSSCVIAIWFWMQSVQLSN